VRGASLLELLAGLIERTYSFRAPLGELGRFVVGDEGYERLVAGRLLVREVAPSASGARLLLRPEGARWALALYYPDSLIARLEEHDPRRGIGPQNLAAFAVFVEELDHLLTVADRSRPGRPPVSLLELEWHAEVTKYLASAHFLARTLGRERLGEGPRCWLRYHLFERGACAEADPALRRRYREARRLAVRFLDRLGPLERGERLRRLRGFHRASFHEKLRAHAA
jgi:hypothetical protein